MRESTLTRPRASSLSLFIPQLEMAGEDELGLLLSTFSAAPDDINSMLTPDLSLEQIQQILSIPPDSRVRTESLSVSSPESGISSSGDLSEEHSPSPWPIQPVSLQQFQDFDNTPQYLKMDTTSLNFSPSHTPQLYNATQQDQSHDEMASILKQLSSESSELLLDSQVDMERLERVKNNFKTTIPIGGDSLPVPGVTVTGPNHVENHYQQSVIVRNVQAAPPPPQVRSRSSYSVDFPSPIVITVPATETTVTMTSLPVTMIQTEEKDKNILQNFEIVSPKVEVEEYLCYCCGEKAGKHSYYGGQVCASCRAFFRRSVQSKYYEIFQCKFDKGCKITSQTRKTCQFCR